MSLQPASSKVGDIQGIHFEDISGSAKPVAVGRHRVDSAVLCHVRRRVEPHDFLFSMYHPKGTRNHAGVNDDKLTAMIEQQARTLDRATRKKQIYDIQRYLADQMYYPAGSTGILTAGLTPAVRDFYPVSDYGRGGEVFPKLWVDR